MATSSTGYFNLGTITKGGKPFRKPGQTYVELQYDWNQLQSFSAFFSKGKFYRAIKVGISRGMRKASIYLAKEMKKRINTNTTYAANAPLTVLFKGHVRPLVGGHTNDLTGGNVGLSPTPTSDSLFNSISWTKVSQAEYHIGSYKVGNSGEKRDLVSDILHGHERGNSFYELDVTAKMARYLYIKWAQASMGASAETILSETRRRQRRKHASLPTPYGGNLRAGGKIRIPHRPWVGKVVMEPAVRDKVHRLVWEELLKHLNAHKKRYLAKYGGP